MIYSVVAVALNLMSCGGAAVQMSTATSSGKMASRNGSSGRASQSDRLMEQENDRLASGLSSKISTLKNIALDIEHEAKYQNSYLDGMGEDMEGTTSLLGGSVKRLSHMVSSGSSNRRLMCYLIAFIVGAFFVGYYILTRVKT